MGYNKRARSYSEWVVPTTSLNQVASKTRIVEASIPKLEKGGVQSLLYNCCLLYPTHPAAPDTPASPYTSQPAGLKGSAFFLTAASTFDRRAR
jgi:hypothetical protein